MARHDPQLCVAALAFYAGARVGEELLGKVVAMIPLGVVLRDGDGAHGYRAGLLGGHQSDEPLGCGHRVDRLEYGVLRPSCADIAAFPAHVHAGEHVDTVADDTFVEEVEVHASGPGLYGVGLGQLRQVVLDDVRHQRFDAVLATLAVEVQDPHAIALTGREAIALTFGGDVGGRGLGRPRSGGQALVVQREDVGKDH